ncbi:hypothetical protein MKW98_001791 [Papaver atlanticum]|uniref:AT-hook motif nuclear-localized protein n=1 Tax=Papaver atlanticum TaxID=357466 RepID=A0AAD4XBZ9_9MAGN|nr:hypothetical protein MKW98_001791 [Papaver atlanticum]
MKTYCTMSEDMMFEMDRSTTEEGDFEEEKAVEINNNNKRDKPLSENMQSISPVFSSSDFKRRSRGRPKGSGNRQLLASLGEWVSNSAGGKFLPHVVTIDSGEDIAAKIISFSRKGPRAICILSANGAVSNGSFEILSLTGSFTINSAGGVRSRTGGLSVSLAGPDGRVVGGAVAGQLLASSKIQVIVGSFLPNTRKSQKRRQNVECSIALSHQKDMPPTAATPISQVQPDEEISFTPMPTLTEQTQGEEEEEELEEVEIRTDFTEMHTLHEPRQLGETENNGNHTTNTKQSADCSSFPVGGQHMPRSVPDQRLSSDTHGYI